MLRPLADAGLSKADVRRLAHTWQLPCADKPAAPCLASRIPHHESVSPEKLRQIEQSEAGLHRLGFDELRVRHHGDIARIELPERWFERSASLSLRDSRHCSAGRFPLRRGRPGRDPVRGFTLTLLSHANE